MERLQQESDVFRSFLVDGAKFCGDMELPALPRNTSIPSDLVEFRRLRNPSTINQFIHFYIPDDKFVSVLKYPRRYIDWFKRFSGIIGFDFSIYADSPRYKQVEVFGKNRDLSYWFANQGVNVIPNVRWGAKDTYSWCFSGLPKNSTVSIGILGCQKDKTLRRLFLDGFSEMLCRLEPSNVIIYGTKNDKLFPPLFVRNTKLHFFESHCTISYRKGVA